MEEYLKIINSEKDILKNYVFFLNSQEDLLNLSEEILILIKKRNILLKKSKNFFEKEKVGLLEKKTIEIFLKSKYCLLAFYGYKNIYRKNGNPYLTHIMHCLYYYLASVKKIDQKCVDLIILHDFIEEVVLRSQDRKVKENINLTKRFYDKDKNFKKIDLLIQSLHSLKEYIPKSLLRNIFLMMEPEIEDVQQTRNVDKRYYFYYVGLLDQIVRYGDKICIMAQLCDRLDAYLDFDYIIQRKDLNLKQKRIAIIRVCARSLGSIDVLENVYNFDEENRYFKKTTKNSVTINKLKKFSVDYTDIENYSKDIFLDLYYNKEYLPRKKIDIYIGKIFKEIK